MTRRHLLARLLSGLAAAALPALAQAERLLGSLKRPASYWRPQLSAAAWAVLFEDDTEPPRSSPLNQEKRAGRYLCAACFQPVFDAAQKYDSGTGWPSFRAALPGAFGLSEDRLLFYVRTEYHCSRCGGHHGHVFDDGPPPTGKRWCNNGLALRFVPAGESLPALRS
ncbi:MAG TPA: peptide-methionine (R)-S-oxide reductase MsrB [Solimonas sp.]|nr:peptide-methionine (R)-S-oxide reductase MsrB [Solimonas sp.]